jgi:hypothetical protein
MVQKDSRREGKLALAVLARMHAKYVMQITSNPKKSVDESYRSWRDHASKGNSYKLISRMDKYYADLWRDQC